MDLVLKRQADHVERNTGRSFPRWSGQSWRQDCGRRTGCGPTSRSMLLGDSTEARVRFACGENRSQLGEEQEADSRNRLERVNAAPELGAQRTRHKLRDAIPSVDELSSAVSRLNAAPWEDPFALALGEAEPIEEEGRWGSMGRKASSARAHDRLTTCSAGAIQSASAGRNGRSRRRRIVRRGRGNQRRQDATHRKDAAGG